jgi:hypothetical protein
MPSLTVFVATTRTQGHRDNDFAHIDGPELVDLAMTCDRDRGNPDGGCGCARAFTRLDSRRGTTTAEVAVRDLTFVQYRNVFHRSLLVAGFADDPDLRREAEQAADEMARIAADWPVGTVVERRGDSLAVRAWPTASTNGRPNR